MKKKEEVGRKKEEVGRWLSYFLLLTSAFIGLAPAPISGTLPIRNGKLQTDLDANGKKILNLDTSNLSIGGGGGGGPALIGANTLLGNNTGGTASPLELTPGQVKAMISLNLVENTALSTWAGTANLTVIGALTSGSVPSTLLTGNLAIARFDAGANASVKTFWNGAGAWVPIEAQQTVSDANTAMAAGTTVMVQNPALTANRTTQLRPAAEYPSGKTILYIDGLTGVNPAIAANFGRSFTPAAGNTLLALLNPPFIAGGINGPGRPSVASFESDGVSTWTQINTNLTANAVEDPTDRRKRFIFNAANQPPGFPSTVTAAVGDSVTVIPEVFTGSAVGKGVNADGTLAAGILSPTDILPNEYVLGDAPDTIPSDGRIDSVKINTPLTATQTYIFTDATLYQSGDKVTVYDATGSLTSSVYAHFVGTNGNTFNGATGFDISQPYFNRTFVADPINKNWSVSNANSNGGLTKAPWFALPVAGGIATLSINPAYIQQNNVVTLTSNLSLSIPNAQNGDSGRLKVRQDASGSRTLALPAGSKTASNGLGVVSLSAGANAEDELLWDFDGQNYNFYSAGLNFTAAAASTYTTIADQGGATTSGTSTQGDSNGSQYFAGPFVACGTSTTCLAAGTPYTIGKVDLLLKKTGLPTYNARVAIYSDNGVAAPGDAPASLLGVSSGPIAVSGFATTAGTITFTGVNAQVIAGTKYWVVYYGDAPTRTTSADGATSYRTDANGVFNGTTTLTSTTAAFTSADTGSTLTTTATGVTLAVPTTITYVNAMTVTLSAAATGSATGTINIASPVVTSTSANFSSADVGTTLAGNKIPSNTAIASVTNATTAVLAVAVTGAATGIILTIGPGNASNYTRWDNTTVAAGSTARKSLTGAWVNTSITRQMRFTTYK